MRGIFKLYLCLTVVAALVSTAACTKLCDSGYEGSNCNTEVRAVFEGIWNALDTPGNLHYMDTINPSAGISGVTLSSSFANSYFAHALNATVVKNTITMPLQQPDSLNHEVQGSGTINSNGTTIIWSYQLINATDSPQIVTSLGGTWTKQP